MDLNIIPSGSTNCVHQHGPLLLPMDTIIAISGSTAHGHQHRFRLQHRPRTSTCPLLVTPAMGINTGSRSSRNMDPDVMTSGGSTGHSHQYGPYWWQHCPWTLTWLQAVVQTMDICIALGGNMWDRHHPSPQHHPFLSGLAGCWLFCPQSAPYLIEFRFPRTYNHGS